MNDAELAVLQRQLRNRVADDLVANVQVLEAGRRVKLTELDQEALTANLVSTAIGDLARSCLREGRPWLPTAEEDRLARAVMDDLFAAGSKLQPYLDDPAVVSVRANN